MACWEGLMALNMSIVQSIVRIKMGNVLSCEYQQELVTSFCWGHINTVVMLCDITVVMVSLWLAGLVVSVVLYDIYTHIHTHTHTHTFEM